MKKTMSLSVRLDEDLLDLMARHAGERGRSVYLRDAIRTHAALLELLAALGCERKADQ